MTLSVIDLVKNRINITFPTITDVRTTRRYHVLSEHIREFGFQVGAELGVSSGETFFNILDANPNLFLYARKLFFHYYHIILIDVKYTKKEQIKLINILKMIL